jgi:hypothetical protein
LTPLRKYAQDYDLIYFFNFGSPVAFLMLLVRRRALSKQEFSCE